MKLTRDRRILLIGLAAGVSALALRARAARARTTRRWTVIKLEDDGTPGTLRSAIDRSGPGDTIVFDRLLDGEIALNRPLYIGHTLTITGPGAEQLAITAATDDGTYANRRIIQVGVTEEPHTVTVKLSGLTMENGQAVMGAAVYNASQTIEVTDCVFRRNESRGDSPPASRGGAIYSEGGALTAVNCIFVDNVANVTAFGYGLGGAICSTEGDIVLRGCSFDNNEAAGGSALWSDGGAVVAQNCRFSGNRGTAVEARNQAVMALTNCAFSGNTGVYGGALACGSDNDGDFAGLTVTNCTFAANNAEVSGGALYVAKGNCEVTNCILWDNTAGHAGSQLLASSHASIHVSYSDVHGSSAVSWWTTNNVVDQGGNIDLDPRFVNPAGHDRIAGTADDNLRLDDGSPCINRGNSAALPADTLDLDGDRNTGESIPYDLSNRSRIADAAVDMGAFEWRWWDRPFMMTVDLRALVSNLTQSGKMRPANGNPLFAKLDATMRSLERENAQAAIGSIGAFSSQATALVRSRRLDAKSRDELVNPTREIMALLTRHSKHLR